MRPEEFSEHRAFLCRLARSLVGDADRAEDVVHDAFVAALEHPPRRATGLRPWLARVVRNRSFNMGRDRWRRDERERAAARPEALPSDEEVVERLEISRHLTDAVRGLRRSYRTVVFLRYFEGRTIAAIAREQGVPHETVKTRLRRALAELRTALDRDYSGGRRGWTLALAPLGQLTVGKASLATGGGLLSVSALAETVWGMLVMKKVVVGCVLMAALCGWLWTVNGVERGTAPTEAQVVVPAVQPNATASAEVLTAPAVESTERQAIVVEQEPLQAVADPALAWILWLDVRGPALDEPVEVTVRARPDGDPFAGQETVSADCNLNERSRIVLDRLLVADRPLAALVIEARHPGLRAQTETVALPLVSAAAHRSPAPVEATLVLVAGARVVGETRDSSGAALAARIGIWRFAGERLDAEILLETDSDANGCFSAELPGEGDYLIVAAHQDLQPAWQRFLSTLASPVHDAGTLVLQQGAVLDGRFTVGGETPPYPVSFTLQRDIEGVILHWDWMNVGPSPGSIVWTNGCVERHAADRVAETSGAFLVEGLVPGHYLMHLHGFDQGHGRMSREPLPLAVPNWGVPIELGWSRVAVRLALEDPAAAPLAATLVLERPGLQPERSDCFGGELTGEAEREFVFDAGEPLAFQLELEGLEPLRHELYAPPAGSREEIHFAVPALDRSASLRLGLSGDLPPEGTPFIVHVASLEHGPARADLGLVGGGDFYTVELSGGSLLLDGLSPGPVVVLAYPGRWPGQRASYLLDASAEVDLLSDGQATVHLRLEAGGRLRVGKRNGSGGWASVPCEISDSGGSVLETSFVSYAPDGGGCGASRGSLSNLAPSDVVPNLVPGHYWVKIDGQERSVAVRAGETVEVVFD